MLRNLKIISPEPGDSNIEGLLTPAARISGQSILSETLETLIPTSNRSNAEAYGPLLKSLARQYAEGMDLLVCLLGQHSTDGSSVKEVLEDTRDLLIQEHLTLRQTLSKLPLDAPPRIVDCLTELSSTVGAAIQEATTFNTSTKFSVNSDIELRRSIAGVLGKVVQLFQYLSPLDKRALLQLNIPNCDPLREGLMGEDGTQGYVLQAHAEKETDFSTPAYLTSLAVGHLVGEIERMAYYGEPSHRLDLQDALSSGFWHLLDVTVLFNDVPSRKGLPNPGLTLVTLFKSYSLFWGMASLTGPATVYYDVQATMAAGQALLLNIAQVERLKNCLSTDHLSDLGSPMLS